MRGSKLDEIMTLLFMLLVAAAAVCAFVSGRETFMAVAGVAIVLRLIQYILRFFKGTSKN